MDCVCGNRTDSGELCERCRGIHSSDITAGTRPWPWVAEQWRARHPDEEPLTPKQCKGIHDRAIHALRRTLPREELEALLQELADVRPNSPRHRQ